MGKVLSVVVRQVNRFNVENRAQKVISQSKPQAAPKYESNLKDLERVLEEYPDLLKEQNRKNKALDENLKQVYVKSSEVEQTTNFQKDPNKPLPLIRTAAEEFEFGHMEPRTVSKGRCTLRQAMDFISKHHTEPSTWTASKISSEFHMKEVLVSDILTHFKTFELHLPEKTAEKRKLLAQPSSNKHNSVN